MNTLNESPTAKIEKYNQKLTQRDQTGITNALSHFNSPLLNSLGRSYVATENVIDYVNKDSPMIDTPTEAPKAKVDEAPKANNDLPDDLYGKVRQRILSKETPYKGEKAYKTVNMLTDNGKPGSGAWGAFQFIWKWHKPTIEIATGYTKPEDFLNDADAQEKYFKYHYDTVLKPYANLFKKQFPESGLTDEQIMDGIHFRGPHGDTGFFEIYRRGELDKKMEGNNPTLAERLQ